VTEEKINKTWQRQYRLTHQPVCKKLGLMRTKKNIKEAWQKQYYCLAYHLVSKNDKIQGVNNIHLNQDNWLSN